MVQKRNAVEASELANMLDQVGCISAPTRTTRPSMSPAREELAEAVLRAHIDEDKFEAKTVAEMYEKRLNQHGVALETPIRDIQFRPTHSDILKSMGPIREVTSLDPARNIPLGREEEYQLPASLPTRPDEIYSALNAIARVLSQEGLGKNSKNKSQGFNFRGIDDVYNLISPLLAQYNVITLPRMSSRTVVERNTKNGGTMFSVALEATYEFLSTIDGSSVEVIVYGEAMDSGDKATNKAMSIAHKYALIQLFSIPIVGTPEDRDPDFSSPQVARTETGRKPVPRAAPVELGRDLEDPADFPDSFPETIATATQELTPIEEELESLVKLEANRSKLATKLCEAFAVLTLDQIPDERQTEAIEAARQFVKQQAARAKPVSK